MPHILITTNVPKQQIPDDFTSIIANDVSRILEKPLTLITVVLRSDVQMFRFGSTEAAASIMIRDIRKFDDKESNRFISEEIMKAALKHLDIVPNRINTILVSADPDKIGLAGGKLLSDVLK
ncbi:phenylpyruvate tautomerase MIF-related protein [Salmonella sp. s55004]|uniref:phenylpyruvate tautomerase MIF-related protein n=1 Tax=Salmonella sp. s55004 TaxID=3159675 RepID=UPI00397F2F5C